MPESPPPPTTRALTQEELAAIAESFAAHVDPAIDAWAKAHGLALEGTGARNGAWERALGATVAWALAEGVSVDELYAHVAAIERMRLEASPLAKCEPKERA